LGGFYLNAHPHHALRATRTRATRDPAPEHPSPFSGEFVTVRMDYAKRVTVTRGERYKNRRRRDTWYSGDSRPVAAGRGGLRQLTSITAISHMPTDNSTTPPEVSRSLVKLGADLNASRRRWRLPLSEVAACAGTSRQTIGRIEKGDPRVAMGTWASVLLTLRLLDRLTDLAAPASKLHAGMIAIEHLPTRVRLSKR